MLGKPTGQNNLSLCVKIVQSKEGHQPNTAAKFKKQKLKQEIQSTAPKINLTVTLSVCSLSPCASN